MRPRTAAAVCALFLLASVNAIPAIAQDPPATDASPGNAQVYVNATAVLETNWGTIKFQLYEEGAPITCANFIKLAGEQFYNGIKFHRCIDDFVAQTGDPNTKNNNPYDDGSGGSGTTIPLEVSDNLTHEDGAVGMARSSEPDSASSQFYICDGPQHGLDGNYAVFGIVIEGLDVAKKIAACPTYGNKRPLLKDHPVDDIVMNSVFIIPGYLANATTNATAPASTLLFLSTPAGGAAVGGVVAGAAAAGAFFLWKKRKAVQAAGK